MMPDILKDNVKAVTKGNSISFMNFNLKSCICTVTVDTITIFNNFDRFGNGGFGARDYRQVGRGGNKHPAVQQNFGNVGINYGFQPNPGYGGSYGGAQSQNDWWGS